jgi:hypothetical protein
MTELSIGEPKANEMASAANQFTCMKSVFSN